MSAQLHTAKLDSFFKSFLDIEGFAAIDSSLNGYRPTMTALKYAISLLV
ncbi:MAG: hypothetical protein LBD48_03005 [Treponema sp.]|nr:hypothetical protein [Treponema sp.]